MFTQPPDPDDPEAVLAFLAEPIRANRDALDDGVSFADITMSNLPYDSHLWAHLVRYRGCILLGDAAAQTANWHISRRFHNSGVAWSRGPLIVKPLKSNHGGPPAPGSNYARRSYFSQTQQMVMQFDAPTAAPAVGANLILEWDVTKKREVIFALSKPKGIWKYQGTPKLDWRRRVVFDDNDDPKFPVQDEDLALDEFDIDLSELDDDDEAGEVG